jgi:hypothetical protein
MSGISTNLLLALFWSSVALTLVVRFIYPRTTFGVVLFIAGLFFIVEMIVVEDAARPVVQYGMMAPFVVWLAALFIRDIVKFVRGADATLSRSAGMSGMYRLWDVYTVGGAAARKYWLWASICTLLILVSLTTVFTLMILKGKQRQITDVDRVLRDFDQEQASWIVWPDDELQTRITPTAWGDWRPKNGDVGRLVWWHKPARNAKYVHDIEILEIADEAGAKHYIAIPAIGTTRLISPTRPDPPAD